MLRFNRKLFTEIKKPQVSVFPENWCICYFSNGSVNPNNFMEYNV